MRRIIALALALLIGALCPETALAEPADYAVVYKGPACALTERGADFFSHMESFLPGQTQAGSFVCRNETDEPVSISVSIAPTSNDLAGAIETEIRRGSTNGESLGTLSAKSEGEIRLCELDGGESERFAFLVTASSELETSQGGSSGKVEWEFTAIADGGGTPTANQTGASSVAPQAGTSAANAKDARSGPLPQTGDGCPIAIALAALLALALSAIARIASHRAERGLS